MHLQWSDGSGGVSGKESGGKMAFSLPLLNA